jgi:DNA-binding transcriptional ArsR family regulator
VSTLDVVSAPFSPLRSRVLQTLREPLSATEVAARLGETRQRVNYHVRALERQGLLELVEERPRRGCTERVMRATCHAVIVEPSLSGALPEDQDRFAADTLLAGGARLVSDVARARAAAAERGQRLLTFAIEAEIGFDRPADLERFADALADRVAELAEELGPGKRRYRVLIGGVPT